ncbi:Uncharacterised protein [Vibrio cholerae]|nr:Uncharacterised protein [Vibrio cholerae]
MEHPASRAPNSLKPLCYGRHLHGLYCTTGG